MIHQLWGPVFDLTGDGGYNAWSFSWFFFKIANVVEIILVALIFVAGLFISLPGRRQHESKVDERTP